MPATGTPPHGWQRNTALTTAPSRCKSPWEIPSRSRCHGRRCSGVSRSSFNPTTSTPSRNRTTLTILTPSPSGKRLLNAVLWVGALWTRRQTAAAPSSGRLWRMWSRSRRRERRRRTWTHRTVFPSVCTPTRAALPASGTRPLTASMRRVGRCFASRSNLTPLTTSPVFSAAAVWSRTRRFSQRRWGMPIAWATVFLPPQPNSGIL